jgi:hypothetical protein
LLAASTSADAREVESEQSKLLEQVHGEWLESCTASGAGCTNSELETVGAINRAANGGR